MEVLGSQPNLPMSVGEDAILAETPAKKNVFISMLRGVLHKFEIPQSALMDERAMQAVDGGIDLKYTTAGLSVRRQGSGVQMKIDPAMIERVRQQGIEELAPFIYRVTPVSSILPLVGLDP